MLRSLAEPEGYRLEALNGDIGHCHDFLFDDELWTLRYMVADTGGWLSGRKVLISPAQLESPDWARQRMPVNLTKAQIEESPPLDDDAPVSRRYERLYNEFHSLPSYWLGSGLWGDFPIPASLTAAQEVRIEPTTSGASGATVADAELEHAELGEGDDVHLRSVREVTGYRVVGQRGADHGGGLDKVGRVVDLIVNDSSWALRAFVVDTSRLPLSKKVLLPVDAIAEIDWGSRQVIADVTAERIEEAPAFDPSEPINERLETVLYDVYGRPAP
ncbi:MAG: PRC-barrel domain-containing protein [Chromatiaceae bacterium]|nr:PRC-barrel domain-containing protein [Chromatiaceae bacterium]MCF8017292.1 PRC-barrel domain-containing protein [Chromatiaceae bacterium]